MMGGTALHLRGTGLPDEQPLEFWVSGGTISFDPVPGAQTVVDGGWIIPGLVDAHCHVGIKYGGGHEDRNGAVAQAMTERDAGVLLLRDAGSPIDTNFIDAHADLPRIIRAGRHVARPKRYIRDLGIDLADESLLPETVAQQAQSGNGWVKLVGDWIDRAVGDLAPLWSDDVLREAIAAAHAHGARVTAHVFGEDALPGLLAAGIDCIEHGTGLTAETIDAMVRNGTALVPTLINIANFPVFAAAADKYPVYAAHMLDLHARANDTVRAAYDAGVAIYAGTDAGGSVQHGRIADEVDALSQTGIPATSALGSACWEARKWLGCPGIAHGAAADLLAYRADPRSGLRVLSRPDLILLRGKVTSATGRS